MCQHNDVHLQHEPLINLLAQPGNCCPREDQFLASVWGSWPQPSAVSTLFLAPHPAHGEPTVPNSLTREETLWDFGSEHMGGVLVMV